MSRVTQGTVGTPCPSPKTPSGGQVVDLSALIRTISELDDHPRAPPGSTSPSPKPHPTRLTTAHALVTSAPRQEIGGRGSDAGTIGSRRLSAPPPRNVDVGVGPNGVGRIAWGIAVSGGSPAGRCEIRPLVGRSDDAGHRLRKAPRPGPPPAVRRASRLTHPCLSDFASETFPQVLLAECDAVSPTTDHAKDGSLPLIMALRTLSSSDPQRGVFFGAAQPTLLHAFPGYLVTCEITLLPPSGAAYVKWTISGFLDDPD